MIKMTIGMNYKMQLDPLKVELKIDMGAMATRSRLSVLNFNSL